MQAFNIVKEHIPKKSFRVESVMGRFDIQNRKIKEQFVGHIDLPETWQIGLIYGASGSGKTTIAKELFSKDYVTEFEYSHDSILDDMPKKSTTDEIANTFTSVGFSSVPSWLKPYSKLSSGQQMRVNLANALLNENELIVFDEFTSMLDRNVARVGSFAIQKGIRKTKKQFIAVTCHEDVKEWLLPDWALNTDSMKCETMGKKKDHSSNFQFSSPITNQFGTLLLDTII